MIKVERAQAATALTALEKVGRNGLTECEHATWFYGGIEPTRRPLPSKPAKAPKFTVYKNEAVKAALLALFGTKCAYCESPYSHLNSMDVEHYRPKSAYINEEGQLCRPGYYWLASSYDNLLPACIDCNRERKLFRRKADGSLVKSKSGKANQFPIAPGTVRATCAAELAAERPLLLNPCDHEPGEHLCFSPDGFVEPARTRQEANFARGRASILVFGLDRADLVAERRGWAILIEAAMQRVLQADRNIREYPDDTVMADQLIDALHALSNFWAPAARFLAMAASMKDTFETVRLAANTYHRAVAAWRTLRTHANRRVLIDCIAEIEVIRRDSASTRGLALLLLRWAGIPDLHGTD